MKAKGVACDFEILSGAAHAFILFDYRHDNIFVGDTLAWICDYLKGKQYIGNYNIGKFIMKNVVIFGDSYSTFKEYIPEGFETYYPSLDVNSVEETWWNRLKKKNDFCLVQNNSWSGSTICYTGYGNSDCSKTSSFIHRYRKLKEESFFDKNPIDTIFVFGGTNDSWANVELGECMLDSWKEEDLFYVRPAISYFVSTLKKDMPFANIIVVINTQIKQEIQDWLKQVAQYYGCSFVELQNVDKQDGHPTVKGMQDICEQIYSATI